MGHMQKYIKEIIEIIRYRDLLRNLVARDIKVRYRRSFLGFVWVMLNPLLMMFILYVVFSELFKVSTKNFTIYLLSGITLWNFFSQSTMATVGSFLGNSNLIKKIYLPKAILPLSVNLSALINFVFSIFPLTAALILSSAPVSPNFYLIPVVLILLFIFSFGISLLLSTLTVFFHDTVHIYEVVLLGWMYATPVFYPETIIPQKFSIVLKLNPLYYYMRLFRSSLYMETSSLTSDLLYGTVFSALSLLLGAMFYMNNRKRIIYYI